MRQKSLYAFYLKGVQYEELAKTLEKIIKNKKPDPNKEKTEGFINFQVGPIISDNDLSNVSEYIYFEFYRSDFKEKTDPLGVAYKDPIKELVPIAITKEPFMLMVFTPNFQLRDHILSELQPSIEPKYRNGLGFSPDFIEFINVPNPEEWMEIVFSDEIEPRGRKGKKGTTHEIIERYSGPEERDKDLERKEKGYVFREFAEVVVALENTSVKLKIYQDGKITAMIEGIKLFHAVPYIAQALKVLKDAEKRYYDLKKSAQGEEGNGENSG